MGTRARARARVPVQRLHFDLHDHTPTREFYAFATKARVNARIIIWLRD